MFYKIGVLLMENNILNTPVLFIIFNNPDTVFKVFEEIKKAKPKQLFIFSDGARKNIDGEKDKCIKSQSILNAIDWECEVKTIFLEDNLGPRVAVSSAIDWFFEHVRKRGKVIDRYGQIGLVLFVATPLPVTGAWTGSLAAVIFGLSFRRAFLSIFIGVFIAGVIVTCLSLLGWVGAAIAGVGLSGLAISSIWKASR